MLKMFLRPDPRWLVRRGETMISAPLIVDTSQGKLLCYALHPWMLDPDGTPAVIVDRTGKMAPVPVFGPMRLDYVHSAPLCRQ